MRLGIGGGAFGLRGGVSVGRNGIRGGAGVGPVSISGGSGGSGGSTSSTGAALILLFMLGALLFTIIVGTALGLVPACFFIVQVAVPMYSDKLQAFQLLAGVLLFSLCSLMIIRRIQDFSIENPFSLKHCSSPRLSPLWSLRPCLS